MQHLLLCFTKIYRYLIVNYDQNNFSVSQNVWNENAPTQNLAIKPANSTASQTPKAHNKLGLPVGGIVGIIVAVVVLVIIAAGAAIFVIYRKRKRRKEKEGKKVDEDDPYRKPEMDGNGKPPVNELYAEGKFGEVDSSSKVEMQGSQPKFPHVDKNRAEIEGSKGGVEMEGTKAGVEMEGSRLRAEMDGDHLAPVEMYAGPHGLYEMPSPITSNSDLPSPMSSGNERSSRSSFGRGNRNKPTPNLPDLATHDPLSVREGARRGGSGFWTGGRSRGQRQSSNSNKVSLPSLVNREHPPSGVSLGGVSSANSTSPDRPSGPSQRSTRLDVPSRTTSPYIASQSSPIRGGQRSHQTESTSNRTTPTNLSASSDEAGEPNHHVEQWNRRMDSRERILPTNTSPNVSPVRINDRRPSTLGAISGQAARNRSNEGSGRIPRPENFF